MSALLNRMFTDTCPYLVQRRCGTFRFICYTQVCTHGRWNVALTLLDGVEGGLVIRTSLPGDFIRQAPRARSPQSGMLSNQVKTLGEEWDVVTLGGTSRAAGEVAEGRPSAVHAGFDGGYGDLFSRVSGCDRRNGLRRRGPVAVGEGPTS